LSPLLLQSTLFNAIVENGKAAAANFPFCTIEPNVGMVTVPDPRLKQLSDISGSKELVRHSAGSRGHYCKCFFSWPTKQQQHSGVLPIQAGLEQAFLSTFKNQGSSTCSQPGNTLQSLAGVHNLVVCACVPAVHVRNAVSHHLLPGSFLHVCPADIQRIVCACLIAC
jgi:hypothetical protein